MRYAALMAVVLTAVVVVVGVRPRGADSAEKKDKKPVGIEKRVPWTTSKIKGAPEPPAPYRTEVVFPKLKFLEPLDMAMIPGTDRLVVAERTGKIFSWKNDPKVEKADLILDMKKTVYAVTFHPQFAKNGYMYVTYIPDPSKETPKGTKLARFEAKGSPPVADRESEKTVLEWPNGGHNGGCLKFGPDGMLYVGTGDGSGIADSLQTGQDLTDLLGSILRIDVDRADEGKGYGIPKDNPFVGVKEARAEIWAYGLRQPWRFSFDPKSKDLWAGEVGQDLWEMVYKIEKGGNYGWSVQEGAHPFRPERKKGPSPILPAVVEQPHSLFRSLTGGYVYHGSRLKDLQGAYIYGDYDTGKIWALRHDGKKVTYHQELFDSTLRVVSFGEDAAGEVYLVDFMNGQIHQLVPAPKGSDVSADFPRKLSETGLFASTKELKPAPGLIPYSVNSQLWSDHAVKERYLALPGESKIEYNTVEYPQPSPGAPRGWRFPDGTVVVKTFFMDMEKGNPKSRRRLETRILHYEQLAGTEEVGDQYWRGYTYIWNEEQTDAVLADANGVDQKLTIKDKDAKGGQREQTWHYPSRTECTLCHTMPAKYVLGLNTLQANKEHDYGGVKANQLRTFEHLGLFTRPLPDEPEKLPHLADYEDAKQPLKDRARSYLQSNCAHCHIKWGGGNAEFQFLATLELKDMGIVNTKPGHGTFDIADAKVLCPGDPSKSLMVHRMKTLGLGRMPHIASSVVDEQGVKLIEEWIKEMGK